VNFPQNWEASTFQLVRLAGTGLSSTTSGISVFLTRVSGAGLCSLFSNFRFRGEETGSTAGRDQFEECHALASKPGFVPRLAETEAQGQCTWFDMCPGRAATHLHDIATYFHLEATGETFVENVPAAV
jgi:hypothetical protein